MRQKLPDHPFKGDESGKDDHDDSNEGDAEEDIVHAVAFPYSLPAPTSRLSYSSVFQLPTAR